MYRSRVEHNLGRVVHSPGSTRTGARFYPQWSDSITKTIVHPYYRLNCRNISDITSTSVYDARPTEIVIGEHGRRIALYRSGLLSSHVYSR